MTLSYLSRWTIFQWRFNFWHKREGCHVTIFSSLHASSLRWRWVHSEKTVEFITAPRRLLLHHRLRTFVLAPGRWWVAFMVRLRYLGVNLAVDGGLLHHGMIDLKASLHEVGHRRSTAGYVHILVGKGQVGLLWTSRVVARSIMKWCHHIICFVVWDFRWTKSCRRAGLLHH